MTNIERRTCVICGGDGWTDGSAELRRDGRTGDTTCLGCDGRGWTEYRTTRNATHAEALHNGAAGTAADLSAGMTFVCPSSGRTEKVTTVRKRTGGRLFVRTNHHDHQFLSTKNIIITQEA